MQKEIIFRLVVISVCALATAKPQNNFNNYPYRPTFSDLDSNYYYTTASPYQQNYIRIWPYIIDQAVSPLYNWNWNSNPYNNGNNGYNGYNAYNPYNWFNNNNGYNNNGYLNSLTTTSPYLSVFNPYGTMYSGKK